ncbi:MAG: alanine--tRNA ligase [Armatimonadetes bacterium]|nr:alanine--tRNA ligase [Armatimonadota bacterium]
MAVARRFLRFFQDRGHTVVASASLVPAGDPTLLFTNAGMVQFKDVFLGLEQRSYVRAASIQRCLRVSGKHNDLEQVGPSPRHHTLFFMAGNFSFGDYFKREAIAYAWEFITQEIGVAPDRLIATVLDDDDEAFAHWRAVGVPEDRIMRMGEKTNFWSMGEIGPCGPTAELHYDWGPQRCTCGRSDCSVALDNDCQRWLEIWNLVFMQYNQAPDGTRTLLPRPGVDTGLGIERIAAVAQQAATNYDTDLFAPIVERVQGLLGHTDVQRQQAVVAYRVIADHVRAGTFLVADGVMPGNEGRAYVLRMILRRAIRFGRRIGFEGPFVGEVADVVIEQMAPDYPELVTRHEFILKILGAEEARFAQTLSAGLERVAEVVEATQARGGRVISGPDAFRLYDTYGFPIEMTRDLAGEAGLGIDEEGFRQEMEEQRRRSREGAGGPPGRGAAGVEAAALDDLPATTFVGYARYDSPATVLAVFRDGMRVDEAGTGYEVVLVLDRTPFYAEAGGQVGDSGIVTARGLRVEVGDACRLNSMITGHAGRVISGRVREGMRVRAGVERERRDAIRRNHTATHLLHQALQEVLGEHAQQAGSLVAPDRLRFDFTHAVALTPQERARVERRVNEMVMKARPVRAAAMTLDRARDLGSKALFGEKYGEVVRVVSVEGYSRELCGGTHLTNTGEVGLFTIISESGVAAGIRRIEAVTGWRAYERALGNEQLLAEIGTSLRAAPSEVLERVHRLSDQVRALERIERQRQAGEIGETHHDEADVGGLRVVTARLEDGAAHDSLRAAGDRLRHRLGSGVYVLASASGDRANLVVMVTPDLTGRGVRADALVRAIAARMGGTGGGKAELAQAAGRDVERLDEALASAAAEVRRLGATS